jgi:hypothetical protein
MNPFPLGFPLGGFEKEGAGAGGGALRWFMPSATLFSRAFGLTSRPNSLRPLIGGVAGELDCVVRCMPGICVGVPVFLAGGVEGACP